MYRCVCVRVCVLVCVVMVGVGVGVGAVAVVDGGDGGGACLPACLLAGCCQLYRRYSIPLTLTIKSIQPFSLAELSFAVEGI